MIEKVFIHGYVFSELRTPKDEEILKEIMFEDEFGNKAYGTYNTHTKMYTVVWGSPDIFKHQIHEGL